MTDRVVTMPPGLPVPRRAVVVPHPPLLCAELTGPAAVAAEPVRRAAADAVRYLLDGTPAGTRPGIVLVGAGDRTRRHAPGAWGTLAGYGVAVRAPDGITGGRGPSLPLSLTVGCRLLDLAGLDVGERIVLQEIAADAPPGECRALGAELGRQRAGTAWLVLADGTTKRTERAPGSFDPRAEGFDGEVVAALADGDPHRLVGVDPALAAELGVAGRAAWQVLAGAWAAAGAVPARADVRYADAPFGVGYVVACWD